MSKGHMKKVIIFVIMAIVVIVLGVTNSRYDYQGPVRQKLNGSVSFIDWQSKNHGMPLILLKSRSGIEQKFHHQRIALTKENLKVGDLLLKESNSKTCKINGMDIQCIQ